MSLRRTRASPRATATGRTFGPGASLAAGPGAPSDFILNPGTEREKILGNTDYVVAEPGDVMHIHSPGGGGRGDPLDREPERVLAGCGAGLRVGGGSGRRVRGGDSRGGDRRGGVRGEAAGDARAATECAFHFGPEREAFEAMWTREDYDALTDTAGGAAGPLAVFREDEDIRADEDGAGRARGIRGRAIALSADPRLKVAP